MPKLTCRSANMTPEPSHLPHLVIFMPSLPPRLMSEGLLFHPPLAALAQSISLQSHDNPLSNVGLLKCNRVLNVGVTPSGTPRAPACRVEPPTSTAKTVPAHSTEHCLEHVKVVCEPATPSPTPASRPVRSIPVVRCSLRSVVATNAEPRRGLSTSRMPAQWPGMSHALSGHLGSCPGVS